MKKPTETVMAECAGGPMDGEQWATWHRGPGYTAAVPMMPDARLAGYVVSPDYRTLTYDPSHPRAMKPGTP